MILEYTPPTKTQQKSVSFTKFLLLFSKILKYFYWAFKWRQELSITEIEDIQKDEICGEFFENFGYKKLDELNKTLLEQEHTYQSVIPNFIFNKL